MELSVTDIIAMLAALLLLIFSAFLLNLKKGNRINQLILSAFLFSNAMYIIGYLLFAFSDYVLPGGIHLFFIGTAFGFLFGPLLLFYSKSLVQNNFKLKWQDILHAVPFIAYNVIYGIYFHFEPTASKLEMIHRGSILPHPFGFWINLIMNTQILVYMSITLIYLIRYSGRIKSLYSSIHHLNLGWLELVVYAFLFMWILDFAQFLFRNTIGIDPQIAGFMTFVSITINFVFANLVIYKGLKQPEHFFRVEKELSKTKYEGSSISEAEIEVYLDKLQHFMNKEKPYLMSSLTLKELADKLDMNPRILSQIINDRKKQNFYDFINSYRIEDAKLLLANPAKRKMTILEILYGVGFNSKSVFNTTFKKYTGLTPSEYKKRHLPYHSHHTVQKSA